MSRALLVSALVAVVAGVVLALPADNVSAVGVQADTADTELPHRPSRIVVRPPVRQVEEPAPAPAPAPGSAPQPLPVRIASRPGRLPGTITFPNDRLQQADDRQELRANAWDWDSMTDGCATTKNCLGLPAGCEVSGGCRALVTVQVVNQRFIFQLRASDASYVAVGLGETSQMFGTSVIECVIDPAGGTNPIKTYLSYTPQDTRGCIRMGDKQNSALDLQQSQNMDGGLFCEVFRVNQTNNVNGKNYDLSVTPYFLQLAYGTEVRADGIGYHGANKVSAAQAVILSEYASVGAVSNWPMKLHGALMVLAWMFAATAGSLAARYFKAAWGKATIGGKAMWFFWHRLLMMLTVAMHVAAVIAALVFLKGWSSSAGAHGIVGGVTTGLALLQGAGGMLRPSPDHGYRPLFNWAHRCQGFVTHILAIVTIFLAVPAAGLPSYSFYILGVYVAFYVAMHAVNSLTEVKSYYFVVIVFGSAVFAIVMLVIVVIGGSG